MRPPFSLPPPNGSKKGGSGANGLYIRRGGKRSYGEIAIGNFTTHAIDTIAALSTPLGQGGIGIIRLSGPQAARLATRLFRPRHPVAEPWPSHRLLLGHIIDPASGEAVDEVLLCLMRAPRSYTREDVVEINCHSGYGVMRRILDLVLAQGARLARPGEFTLRAFLSGRLDLTQAEAVLEVVQARTEAAARVAAAHLEGGLGGEIRRQRDVALNLLAQIEAVLDFPEEIPETTGGDLLPSLETLTEDLARLAATYARGRLLREGLRLVIAGRPNVGKSSLLNRLLRQERAIVTDIPGTTRDVITESMSLAGLPVCLVDTAGLRLPGDQVEVLGVRRTQEELAAADLVLYVVDVSDSASPEDAINLAQVSQRPTILVYNKIDLPPVLKETAFPDWSGPRVRLSARTGEGLAGLEDACRELILKGKAPVGGQIVTQTRHAQHLESALACLDRAQGSLQAGLPLEFPALDLREAVRELGEILGEEIGEEILDRIFSQFCLGK